MLLRLLLSLLLLLMMGSPSLSTAADLTDPAISPPRASATDTVVSPESSQPIAGPTDAATATAAFTLADALHLALRNNREIAGQRSSVAIAREQVREARTHGLPRLGAQNLQTHVQNLPTLGNTSIGLHDSNVSKLILQQPLYTFGRVETAMQAAREIAGAERLALQAKEADIALRVIQTYVQLLKKRNRAGIARETLAVLERHLELTRTLFEAGVVLSTDVATTKVRMLEARQKVIEEENACAIAREALGNLLVVPATELGEPESLSPHLLPRPDASPSQDLGQVEDNPEVRRFDGLIRGLNGRKKVEARGTLPTISLQASYDTGNSFKEHYPSWSSVLVVDVPLFEGGLARSRTRQAQHEIERTVQTRELVRDNLQLAKTTSLLHLRELEKKIVLAQEALRTAQENLDQNTVNYREGTVLNTDVLEAQLLLNDAKVTLNNALFDYVTYQAEYARHVGQLDRFLHVVVDGASTTRPIP